MKTHSLDQGDFTNFATIISARISREILKINPTVLNQDDVLVIVGEASQLIASLQGEFGYDWDAGQWDGVCAGVAREVYDRGVCPNRAEMNAVIIASCTYPGSRKVKGVLAPEDIRYIRRLAGEINRRCENEGFYTAAGSRDGSIRKFDGKVIVRNGRLMARQIGGDKKFSVDLTGAVSVEGFVTGTVTASRCFCE